MIELKTGSIFDSDTQCLINPVNCVGVMGKGLALEFKKEFPSMFPFYRKHCLQGDLRYGTVGFYVEKSRLDKIVCLFPTKMHWRDRSTVGIIDASLRAFVKYAPTMKIKSAAFPKVGCGLGGLHFDYQVMPLLERHFFNSTLQIEVYI
jgi:O-acetyl-ADP-ribose deacetylase (regulator of RNase III)